MKIPKKDGVVYSFVRYRITFVITDIYFCILQAVYQARFLPWLKMGRHIFDPSNHVATRLFVWTVGFISSIFESHEQCRIYGTIWKKPCVWNDFKLFHLSSHSSFHVACVTR